MVTVCGSGWTARKSFSNLVSFFSKRRERGPNSCQGRNRVSPILRAVAKNAWRRRRNDRCRDIDDDGELDTKRNRTRARACANPRLITSLTLFTTSTNLLSPFESIVFPQSERWFQARLGIMAVLIAFSYVASFLKRVSTIVPVYTISRQTTETLLLIGMRKRETWYIIIVRKITDSFVRMTRNLWLSNRSNTLNHVLLVKSCFKYE